MEFRHIILASALMSTAYTATAQDFSYENWEQGLEENNFKQTSTLHDISLKPASLEELSNTAISDGLMRVATPAHVQRESQEGYSKEKDVQEDQAEDELPPQALELTIPAAPLFEHDVYMAPNGRDLELHTTTVERQ